VILYPSRDWTARRPPPSNSILVATRDRRGGRTGPTIWPERRLGRSDLAVVKKTALSRSQRRSLLGSAMGEEAKPELMVHASGQPVVNGSQWRRSGRPVPLATCRPPRWETDKPLAAIRHRGLGAILRSHLGGVGLDLVAAVPAPQAERNSYETGLPPSLW
jgi:hypothetical protein